MSRLLSPFGVLILAAIALVASSAFFTVHERERAIKVRLGNIERADYEPGLYAKFPFFDTVHRLDGRILTLDIPPKAMLTSENKNVIVDFFVKWRIDDTETFYKVLGISQGAADDRLSQLSNDAVRNAFRSRTVRQVVSFERVELTEEIIADLLPPAAALGMEIVDVRIKKVEMPEDVRESVYQRMEKDRAKIARELRSQGEEDSKKIRATANRVREETLARAYAQSEQTRGAGDGESARVYAEAYSQNPEFYSLYRSLSAYQNAFSGDNNVLLLKPDSEFFRFFNGAATALPASK